MNQAQPNQAKKNQLNNQSNPTIKPQLPKKFQTLILPTGKPTLIKNMGLVLGIRGSGV